MGSGTRCRPANRVSQFPVRPLILPVFLVAGALATRAADNPGIVKGSDQFELSIELNFLRSKAKLVSGYL